MNVHLLLRGLLVWFYYLTVTPTSAATAKVAPEDSRIEDLIRHVASLRDATFIRNGRDHDAATAAKFLRGKWEAQRGEVRTAADFITKVASQSATTGTPYRIRFKEGRTMDCGPYLRQRLEAEQKQKPTG